MAEYRPKISNVVKKALYAEAGNKCANPGCSNTRTQIHHIREWSVYKTHDRKHLIAVCPACHDAIHHGSLDLSDSTVYGWKNIERPKSTIKSHLYVEPHAPCMLKFGPFGIRCRDQVIVFELSPLQRLNMTIVGNEILLVDLSLSSPSGVEVLRITQNHVTHHTRREVEFTHVPGSIKIVMPCNDDFFPDWLVQYMRTHEPNFGAAGVVTALQIAVTKPGVASVEGVWCTENKALIATAERLFLVRKGQDVRASDFKGNAVFDIQGGVNFRMFGF
jgi:hypothetical protein